MPGPTTDDPVRSRVGAKRLRNTAITFALGIVLFTVGALGLAPQETPPGEGGQTGTGPHGRDAAGPAGSIEALRERVRRLPTDHAGWSALGMAFVQQARSTADPATYDRAEAALRKSLALQPTGNSAAEIGMGALEAARHDFTEALVRGRRAVATNPYSAPAQGVLADALTQLGRYEESYRAVQRMTDLRPDSGALARASYTWELRGDTGKARDLMRRSLEAAGTAPEKAFAHTHLSTLALESGDPRTALREAGSGLAAVPGDAALLEARARAHTALGHHEQAVTDYTAALAVAPLPQYLLGLGELQQSLGDKEAAEAQFELLRTQSKLRTTSRAVADVDEILFEADHGDPGTAVAMGRAALRQRPFIAVHDALAWALHRDGRDTEAIEQADLALELGTRSALFHYHRALIHHSLGHLTEARPDLRRALSIDPHFHPVHAREARTVLSGIDASRRIDASR